MGIEHTSLLLIRFMVIMAIVVILINGLTKGDWLQALLFVEKHSVPIKKRRKKAM